MCARATDMIGELALAISRGITAGELAGVIHPHPTFSETLGETLLKADDRPLHTR